MVVAVALRAEPTEYDDRVAAYDAAGVTRVRGGEPGPATDVNGLHRNVEHDDSAGRGASGLSVPQQQSASPLPVRPIGAVDHAAVVGAGTAPPARNWVAANSAYSGSPATSSS